MSDLLEKNHDPLQPHSHDPNPDPPSDDPTFTMTLPNGRSHSLTLDDLHQLPQTAVADCYIVSTGHGASGPFTFNGVRLLDLIGAYVTGPWSQAEVLSGDGFGSRVLASELEQHDPRPILLAHAIDGVAMTRQQGLVRLIVPDEEDDALRQVKWVGKIDIL